MRRYASSRLRILLLCGMIAAITYILGSGTGYAQSNAGGAAAKPHTTVFSLILSNIDFIFIVIVALSITGLTLIIQGFIKNRASVFMPPETTEQLRDMIQQRKFKELMDFTESDPSFVSRALNPALKRAPSFSSMKEAMETAIGEQTAEQFRKIEYLNIIGNLGPLLGLLGTVYGMVIAFEGVQSAGGQADVGVLSGGIAKALCHTMLGLLLAIPCLAAFGVLRTMVDRLTVAGALQAEELLLMIKPAEARPAPAAGVARPGVMPQPAMRKAPLPAPSPAGIPGQ